MSTGASSEVQRERHATCTADRCNHRPITSGAFWDSCQIGELAAIVEALATRVAELEADATKK